MNAVIVLGADTGLLQNHGEVFKSDVSRSISFKKFFDDLRVLAMNDNLFNAGVVEIAERSTPGKISLTCLLPQSSCGVRAQLTDIFVRHAQLDGHHQHVVVWIMASVVRLYVPDYSLLEKPLNLSAINGVASQAVYFPTNNALCLTSLYALEHIVKNGASGHFGGSLFYELVRNGKILMLGECPQFGELGFNGEDLLVLDISRFSGVEKIFCHNFPLVFRAYPTIPMLTIVCRTKVSKRVYYSYQL